MRLSWCIPLADRKLRLHEVVLFGILGALTFALQVVMAPLPNIEPVSLLVMLYGAVFGWKSLYCVYIFVTMEILFHGIGLWNVNYLYIWTLLAFAAIVMRGSRSCLSWAMLSGVYGLCFGALCGIVDVFIGGIPYAVTKWISGIPFDITHCIGNFCIALILFQPLRKRVERLWGNLRR